MYYGWFLLLQFTHLSLSGEANFSQTPILSISNICTGSPPLPPFSASFSPRGDRITAVVPVRSCGAHSVIYVIVTLYLAGSKRVTQIVFLPDKHCLVDLMLII